MKKLLALLICSTAILAACGGDVPSDREVRNAMFEWNKKFRSGFGRLSDDAIDEMRAESKELKIRGCKGKSYVVCDIEGNTTLVELQRYDGDWTVTGFTRR